MVAHPERVRVLTAARRRPPYGELAFWLLAMLLVSPLLIYYRAGVMPLAALFTIAAGIALGLALTGRRLHGVLLDDALSARDGKGRFLMTFGMALLLAVSRAPGVRGRAALRAATGVAQAPGMSYYRSGPARGGWGGGETLGLPAVTPVNKALMIACGVVWGVQLLSGPIFGSVDLGRPIWGSSPST